MIPTYNQEDYILEAIKSALSQNYQNLEVVVCDDCSQDNSCKLINSIKDRRLKIYKNEKNIGRVRNYRKLLYELATGDFVINLDGDDYFIDNNYIEKAIELVKQYDLDLVFSNQIIGYKDRQKETNMNLPTTIDGNWLFLNYGKKGIHIPHMTAIYKRSKAMRLHFYTKDIISADWESILRFIINSKVGFISECSGVWRQLDTSESKTNIINRYFTNINQLLSVCDYAEDFFTQEEIVIWKNRLITNLLRDIPLATMSCNSKKVINYAYKKLSLIKFINFIVNYRFLGKIFLGKVKNRCVQ